MYCLLLRYKLYLKSVCDTHFGSKYYILSLRDLFIWLFLHNHFKESHKVEF